MKWVVSFGVKFSVIRRINARVFLVYLKNFITHKFQAASNKAEESFTKLSDAEAQAVQGRVDVISYACQAEINHFNQNRVGDFKGMMQKYLQGQISFYQNVSGGNHRSFLHRLRLPFDLKV